jgi:hypothetical protein
MVKTSNIGRQLSELEVERQRSCNVSALAACLPTPLHEQNAINTTNPNMRQNHLQANSRLELFADLENITSPEVCTSRWLENAIAVRETLVCVEDYMEKEELRRQRQEP